jgi:thioredoxin-dependent peroxiredoxin
MKVGQHAPDFTLSDQDGTEHTLSHYKGSWVLVYFYPKDDTPGCTKEACVLRDALPNLKALDTVVFGISGDSVKSHKKFAEKYELPFTLLADENKKVIQQYGVWGQKQMMGRTYMGVKRTSFLIDSQGKIVKIYESVKPDRHAEEVINDLKTFRAG